MNTRKDLLIALVGGLGFAVVWMMLELLLAPEPDLIFGAVGGMAAGLAWFVGSLVLQRLFRNREDREETASD